jgi:hypothetical protein
MSQYRYFSHNFIIFIIYQNHCTPIDVASVFLKAYLQEKREALVDLHSTFKRARVEPPEPQRAISDHPVSDVAVDGTSIVEDTGGNPENNIDDDDDDENDSEDCGEDEVDSSSGSTSERKRPDSDDEEEDSDG